MITEDALRAAMYERVLFAIEKLAVERAQVIGEKEGTLLRIARYAHEALEKDK